MNIQLWTTLTLRYKIITQPNHENIQLWTALAMKIFNCVQLYPWKYSIVIHPNYKNIELNHPSARKFSILNHP